jgi:hypothetical protein
MPSLIILSNAWGCGLFFNVPYSSACAIGYFGDVKANGAFLISGVPAGSYTVYGNAGDYVGQQIATDSLGNPPLTSVPPVYTGRQNVVLKGDLSGVSVKVKLEANNSQ